MPSYEYEQDAVVVFCGLVGIQCAGKLQLKANDMLLWDCPASFADAPQVG